MMCVYHILVQCVLQREPFEAVVYVPVEHPDAADSRPVRNSHAADLGNEEKQYFFIVQK